MPEPHSEPVHAGIDLRTGARLRQEMKRALFRHGLFSQLALSIASRRCNLRNCAGVMPGVRLA